MRKIDLSTNPIVEIEGGEGSGKGTIVEAIRRRFLELGIDANFFREPGSTSISEQIRSVIVNKSNTMMDPITEAMLFAASRNQLMKEKVLPEVGKRPIIFDRMVETNYVYQGIVRGLGEDKIEYLNKFALEGINVNYVIYLDLDPEIGLKRIADNNRITNRFDVISMDFHKKVREGYLERAKNDPRYIVVDASGTPEEVKNTVFGILGILY